MYEGGEQAVKILFLHYQKNGQDETGAVVAGGDVRWYNHLEDSLLVSYKSKCTLTEPPSNCVPCSAPKEDETLFSLKNLHQVYGSLIRNCQNLKATRMLFSR